jgi:hypothetical protein
VRFTWTTVTVPSRCRTVMVNCSRRGLMVAAAIPPSLVRADLVTNPAPLGVIDKVAPWSQSRDVSRAMPPTVWIPTRRARAGGVASVTAAPPGPLPNRVVPHTTHGGTGTSPLLRCAGLVCHRPSMSSGGPVIDRMVMRSPASPGRANSLSSARPRTRDSRHLADVCVPSLGRTRRG